MAVNDEREKLRQAKEWLETCEVSSPHFKAAWEHITWLLTHGTLDPAVRAEAQQLADRILGRNALN